MPSNKIKALLVAGMDPTEIEGKKLDFLQLEFIEVNIQLQRPISKGMNESGY